MPRRNLIVIFLTLLLCLVCYHRADRTRYAHVFGQAMDVISQKYVEPVDEHELFEGAMEGMLSRLDEHSTYIGPEAKPEFQADLDQQFGGIGIEVMIDRDTERLMVMSPLLDTPAYAAGLQTGDIILKIDDQDTKGMSLRESVKIMRGKPGSKVRLTVLHRGEDKSVEFQITRKIIQTESVLGDLRDRSGKWRYYLEENPRIGYIRITTFGEHTVSELEKALRFDDHHVDALILDLRNNAGGFLGAAVDVCDMFISQGRIVTSRGRDGQWEEVYRARADKTIVPAGIPIAILVNEFSASAAEIVPACLQDHGRAKIIGTRTYGKGTVQNLIPLEGGKSVLKLTTASYWRPSNQNIHRRKGATDEDQWGVKPNPGLEVKLDKEQAEKVFLQRRERDILRTDVNGRGQPPERKPPTGSPAGHEADPATKQDGKKGTKDDAAKITPENKDDAAKDTQENAAHDSQAVSEPDASKDAAGSADAEPADDGPVDDPQLRRAIEYLEAKLAKTAAAA